MTREELLSQARKHMWAAWTLSSEELASQAAETLIGLGMLVEEGGARELETLRARVAELEAAEQRVQHALAPRWDLAPDAQAVVSTALSDSDHVHEYQHFGPYAGSRCVTCNHPETSDGDTRDEADSGPRLMQCSCPRWTCGHCRHDLCQDCDNCCSCRCADPEGLKHAVLGEFIPCANPRCRRGEWSAKAAQRGWEQQPDGSWLDPQCAADADERRERQLAADEAADAGDAS